MEFTAISELPGWSIGPEVPEDSLYEEPPQSDDPGFMIFIGMREADQRHRFYRVPATTPPAEIVAAFQVGSQGAESYSYDVSETVQLVAKNATQITQIISGRVIFADAAGLKLKFSRQISDLEVERLEAFFPEDQQMQAGLDGYLSDWDGEGPLLGAVKEQNMVHLWWD